MPFVFQNKWLFPNSFLSFFLMANAWEIWYFWHDKPNYILDSWLLETFVLIMIFTTYCFYLTWSLCWKVKFTENSSACNVYCITSPFSDLFWHTIVIRKYKMFSSIFFRSLWITQWCPVLGFQLSISHTAIQVKEETMQYVYQCAKLFSRSLWTSVSPHQLTSNLWINKFPKKKTKQYSIIFNVIL